MSVIAIALVSPIMATTSALPGLFDIALEDAARAGRWDPAIIEGEAAAVSMALLSNGRVLYWSGVEAGGEDNVFFLSHPHEASTRVLDLSGPTPRVITPPHADGAGDDLFCAGHTILPDGRVLAAGGTDWTTMPASVDLLVGSPDARVFDASVGPDGDWVRVADMGHGRWYPSVIPLPNGNAFVASGLQNLSRPGAMQTMSEEYDVAADAWTTRGDHLLPMYPRLTVVPSGPMVGKIFYNTVGTLWGPFGEDAREGPWSLQQLYDPSTEAWQYLGPSAFGARQHAASVLLPLDAADGYAARILTFGGTLQRSTVAVPFAEVADLTTYPPTNRLAAPLNEARWHLNGVLLPDGNVLAVGGGRYDNVIVHGQPNVPILSAELYDPATDAWTLLPEMQVPRMYHSSALLLPDGRVLVGGHVPLPIPWKDGRENVPGEAQIVETRLEIFEPPYLFRGERPVITAAPASVAYGESFVVTVTHESDLASATLVRPGATTHAFDSAQRVIKLEMVKNGDGTVTVTAPPDANVAQPGDWMLFMNRDTPDGVTPSVASFLKLA